MHHLVRSGGLVLRLGAGDHPLVDVVGVGDDGHVETSGAGERHDGDHLFGQARTGVGTQVAGAVLRVAQPFAGHLGDLVDQCDLRVGDAVEAAELLELAVEGDADALEEVGCREDGLYLLLGEAVVLQVHAQLVAERDLHRVVDVVVVLLQLAGDDGGPPHGDAERLVELLHDLHGTNVLRVVADGHDPGVEAVSQRVLVVRRVLRTEVLGVVDDTEVDAGLLARDVLHLLSQLPGHAGDLGATEDDDRVVGVVDPAELVGDVVGGGPEVAGVLALGRGRGRHRDEDQVHVVDVDLVGTDGVEAAAHELPDPLLRDVDERDVVSALEESLARGGTDDTGTVDGDVHESTSFERSLRVDWWPH